MCGDFMQRKQLRISCTPYASGHLQTAAKTTFNSDNYVLFNEIVLVPYKMEPNGQGEMDAATCLLTHAPSLPFLFHAERNTSLDSRI